MIGTNYGELVDEELISRADEHHAAQVSRLAAAREQAQAAEKERDAALAVRSDAIEGKSDLSPMDAEHGVEIAERAHRVAALVCDAAERGLSDAEAGRRKAEAIAWRGVYLNAVRRRIAAARAGEEARAALEAADREHAEATLSLNEARNHGTVGVEAAHQIGSRYLPTEQEELTMWINNGFDPVNGNYFHWI